MRQTTVVLGEYDTYSPYRATRGAVPVAVLQYIVRFAYNIQLPIVGCPDR